MPRTINTTKRQAALEVLAQSTGTEHYYQTIARRLVYTDGVKLLAEAAGAYWLIDAIMSHQPEALRNEQLREIQFWKLEVNADNSAVLYCCEDTPRLDLAKISQKIEYSDFPLDSVMIYVALADEGRWVMMLPNEY